jgi:Cof subfamily protein (haloacid dehalogenase superfamily)
MSARRVLPARIELLISDVDGTLVTNDKRLTPGVRAAVLALDRARIAFAVVSSRPAFGMRMLVEPLRLKTPMAAFNGGLIVPPDRLDPVEGNAVPVEVARRSIGLLAGKDVGIWIHTEKNWFVLDSAGAYVDHEIRTIQTMPTVIDRLDRTGVIDHAYKIVGVSTDFDLLARCERELAAELGTSATVTRSQLYYLDVTHPLANKGHAVQRLSQLLDIPASSIAVIGDGRNDIAMFAVSALAVAMGNAEPQVQQAADFVSTSNEEDGFAVAVERWILPRGAAPAVAASGREGSP